MIREEDDGIAVAMDPQTFISGFCISSEWEVGFLGCTTFGVDAVEDFKEYMLRDYYCWLKTYCCWYKLKLLDNAAHSVQIVSAVQIVNAVSIRVNTVSSKLLTPYISLRDKDLQKSKDPQVVSKPFGRTSKTDPFLLHL
nr:hypothetical protein [Tanacetum cinerariifolium]